MADADAVVRRGSGVRSASVTDDAWFTGLADELARCLVDAEICADACERLLEAALHELSPAEREVVALRVLLELDGPSAARVLGISQTACSTRLSRALRRLEERMSDVGE